jgi:uncharacterized membrane protein
MGARELKSSDGATRFAEGMRRLALVLGVVLGLFFAIAWILNFLKDPEERSLLTLPIIWAEIVAGSTIVGLLAWFVARVVAWIALGFIVGRPK